MWSVQEAVSTKVRPRRQQAGWGVGWADDNWWLLRHGQGSDVSFPVSSVFMPMEKSKRLKIIPWVTGIKI